MQSPDESLVRLATLKHRLLPGSALFSVTCWLGMTERELNGLILRFATREHQSRTRSGPMFCWRRRRLGAVAVYEARFGRVPDIFRGHVLPGMNSYYVHDGRYVWTGKPVEMHKSLHSDIKES